MLSGFWESKILPSGKLVPLERTSALFKREATAKKKSKKKAKISMNSSASITTLRGLLQAFLDHEKKQISNFKADGFKIVHGPTIGDIYEGLTERILNKAIPEALGLRVTNGFIKGKDGSLSGQIDCMLVRGFGVQIPNTSHEIIEMEKVLVVLEVKKTLYGNDFADILHHFNQLMVLEPNVLGPLDRSDIFRTFSQITGIHIEQHEEVNGYRFNHQLVYHSLVSEFVRPLRIALGYDGFKTELGLRNSFTNMIDSQIGKRWIPPTSWPDLLISGQFTMVKLNGRPFVVPSQDDFWKIFATSSTNPIHLLLEFIFTRISKDVSITDFWGDDLDTEVLNPFLEAKAIDKGDKSGWEWQYTCLTKEQLLTPKPFMPWSPYFCNDDEAIVFTLLAESSDGLDIVEIEKGIGEKTEGLVQKLIRTGLVAKRGNKIHLTTTQLRVGFFSGKIFVGEDNTGRLMRWAIKEMENKP